MVNYFILGVCNLVQALELSAGGLRPVITKVEC